VEIKRGMEKLDAEAVFYLKLRFSWLRWDIDRIGAGPVTLILDSKNGA